MPRHLLAGGLFLAAALATAQDRPKWEPPPVPDGWRAVTGKDNTYRFAVPKSTARAGSRDHTRAAAGVRVAAHLDYFVLKDGTELTVEVLTVNDAALKGLKGKTPADLILDAETADGFAVSAPRDVALGGDTKGKEYRLTKGGTTRRLVVVVVAARPRVYALDVAATAPDGPDADAFLKSFVLLPPDVVKELAKEWAAKDEIAGKENEAKFGAKWTLDLKKMTPPGAPAAGVIRGKEFRPDKVTLEGGRLVFRQGKEFFADAQVELVLFTKFGQSVEGKTLALPATLTHPAGSPHLVVSAKAAGAKLPQPEPFVGRYALNLTFGTKADDGTLPGTIYLCAPDAGKSFVAGKFSAAVR